MHLWPEKSPHKEASNAEDVSIWRRYHVFIAFNRCMWSVGPYSTAASPGGTKEDIVWLPPVNSARHTHVWLKSFATELIPPPPPPPPKKKSTPPRKKRVPYAYLRCVMQHYSDAMTSQITCLNQQWCKHQTCTLPALCYENPPLDGAVLSQDPVPSFTFPWHNAVLWYATGR